MSINIEIMNKLIEKLRMCPISVTGAIIYGSFVKGTFTKDSDIDLLIVASNIHPKKHKRGKEIARIKEYLSLGIPLDILLLTAEECISNFKNHNPLFLDIAVEGVILIDENEFLKTLIEETKEYIKKKNIEKLIDGWRFPIKHRQSTYLSNISNKDFAIAMLTDGERDFLIGYTLVNEGYFDKAVYHFQQSAEKSIKAILISFGVFKKTHFVGEVLIETLKTYTIEEEWRQKLYEIASIILEIEPEVTWSRYPGIDEGQLWIPYEEYNIEDALEVKEKSQKILETAKDFIKWWFKINEEV